MSAKAWLRQKTFSSQKSLQFVGSMKICLTAIKNVQLT